MKYPSHVRLFVIPRTVAYQAPPPMEFSRQEYWSVLPFPSPEDPPNPGIEPRSPTLQEDAIPSEPPGKPYFNMKYLTSNFTHPNSLSQVFMVFFASGSKMSLISVSCCAFLPLLHLSWSLIHHHTNPVQEPLPFPMHPAHLCLSDLFL